MTKLALLVLKLTVFAVLSALLWFPFVDQSLHAQDNRIETGGNKPPLAKELLLYGVIETPAQHLRTIVRLTPDSNGKWSGTTTSIDQKNTKLRLANVVYDNDKLLFTVPSTDAEFDGTRYGDTIFGNWSQRGTKLELKLRIVDEIPADNPTEVYQGDLDLVLQKMKMQLRIYRAFPGDPTSEIEKTYFDSLSEGQTSLLTNSEQNGDEITIAMPVLRAIIKCKLNETRDQMEGSFSQGPVAVKLVLNRVDAADTNATTKPNRPQTPSQKPDYRVEYFEVENKDAEDVTLAGTITLPAKDSVHGPGPYPTVVLISGSGPQNRDEEIMDHRPFAVIADHFAKQGIATLRYDDRGVGKSTGQFDLATTSDFASDAEAVFAYARQLKVTDSDRIGLVGHSEGATVATIAAARNPRVAFVIMLAGAGVEGSEVLLSQSRRILQLSGVSAEQTQRDQLMRIRLHQLAINESDLATARPRIKDILKKAYENKSTSPEQLDILATTFEQFWSPWMQEFLTLDPAESFQAIDVPVLALWGSKDSQVLEDLNREALEKAIADKSDDDQYQFKTFAGLNHLFQPCITGLINEYAEIETTISHEVLTTMSDFISDTAGK